MGHPPQSSALQTCLLTAGGLAVAGWALHFSFPTVVESLTTRTLRAHIPHFDSITLPQPTIGLDYIRYNDVQLDEDGINTIGALTFMFSPLHVITGRFKKLIIEEAEIISSHSPEAGMTFDGWLAKDGIAQALRLEADHIIIKAMDFTFLTQAYGGVTLTVDANATRRDRNVEPDPVYDIHAIFETQQRYITLSGNANGGFSSEFFSCDLDFSRGRVGIPAYDIQISRVSGAGRFHYAADDLSLFADLQAGGMRLSALPWKHVAMTYADEGTGAEVHLSAHSSGVEGLELAISLPTGDAPPETRIHANSQALWNRYIAAHHIKGEDLEDLIALLARLNTEIELE